MIRKNFRLTQKEKDALLALNPEKGDYVILNRNHPHVSKDHPFLHIDSLTFVYMGGQRFKYVGKEHIPVDPAS